MVENNWFINRKKALDSVKIPLMGYDFPPSAPHLLTGYKGTRYKGIQDAIPDTICRFLSPPVRQGTGTQNRASSHRRFMEQDYFHRKLKAQVSKETALACACESGKFREAWQAFLC